MYAQMYFKRVLMSSYTHTLCWKLIFLHSSFPSSSSIHLTLPPFSLRMISCMAEGQLTLWGMWHSSLTSSFNWQKRNLH